MKIRVMTAIAALAIISACGTSTTLSPQTSPKHAVRTIDLAAATELKVGHDLPVVATLPTKLGEREAHFTGFADDNTLFGSMGLPEPTHDTIPGATESRTYPFLYDLKSEKFTVLDESSRSVVPYVEDIATSGDTVVWVEGHGVAMGTSDFELRAFDRSSGTVTKLGRFNDTSDSVVYGNDLLIHDDNAYFSTRAIGRKKGQRPAIHSVPVDGSRAIKVLVPDAGNIDLDGQSLTFDQKDGQQAIDLTTGAITPVPANRFADDPGFCGAVKNSQGSLTQRRPRPAVRSRRTSQPFRRMATAPATPTLPPRQPSRPWAGGGDSRSPVQRAHANHQTMTTPCDTRTRLQATNTAPTFRPAMEFLSITAAVGYPSDLSRRITMTNEPSTEPATNPNAADDPKTETPNDDNPSGTPVDNPSGADNGDFNEGQGDDVASGGS